MKEWLATTADAGKRLDVWLTTKSKLTRKAVKQRIDGGAVRINGKRVAIAKWALQPGDRVKLMDLQRSNSDRERQASFTRLKVLHEDRDLIIVSKPAGVLVLSEVDTAEPTLIDMARAYLRRKYPGARGTYVRAVHRIDRDTTGIVVLALSKAGEKIVDQFKQHRTQREYAVIVHGRVEDESGTIDIPLIKGEFGFGRKVMAQWDVPETPAKKSVNRSTKEGRREAREKERAAQYGDASGSAGDAAPPKSNRGGGDCIIDSDDVDELVGVAAPVAKRAITHFTVDERYLNATLLKVRVETGRTHQIRVHFSSIGHPLLGDRRYGLADDPVPTPRQMLHATRLAFHHPVTGHKLDIKLTPPPDFTKVVDRLRDSV